MFAISKFVLIAGAANFAIFPVPQRIAPLLTPAAIHSITASLLREHSPTQIQIKSPVKLRQLNKSSTCGPKLFIGEVKDARTKKAITGAEIRLSGKGIPPVQYTDSQGVFVFPLANPTYVRVQINAKGYQPYDRRLTPSPSSEPEEFRLQALTPSLPNSPRTRRRPVTYYRKVNGPLRSGITVTKGNRVSVMATGQVSVGLFVGNVGPDGKATNMGASLSVYNIVKQFPHGALMYRLGSKDNWKLCGSSKSFIAAFPGPLEFEVNDNEQTNNGRQDFFNLAITVS